MLLEPADHNLPATGLSGFLRADKITVEATAGCPRLERWQRMMDAVRRVTDRLGKPVDQSVRKTVAALNLLGLATIQSCEGHANGRGHGLPAPWVDFAPARAGQDPGDRVQVLLDEFYSGRQWVSVDLCLRYHKLRLFNGGSFEALDIVRRRLADGEMTPAEKHALQRRLAARQAEMSHFTKFLCAKL